MTTTRRATVLALAITAGALALRLFRLHHLSYWHDESLSVLAARLPLGEIAMYHLDEAVRYTYPPLYTYVLHAWFAVFGSSAYAGRSFSAVCGTAAVFLLFGLVRRFAGAPAGLLAAALVAASQIGVAYSQETRAYALMFVLALGAAWLLDVALAPSNTRREGGGAGRRSFARKADTRSASAALPPRLLGACAWLGFCALSAAMALTHYHMLWVLLGLWGWALAAPAWGLRALPLRWWIGGVALCLVIVGPWLVAGGLAGLSAARAHWPELPSYFQGRWERLYEVIGSYHNARWSGMLYEPNPKPTLAGFVIYTLPALLALGAALFVLLVRRRVPGRSEQGAILLGLTAALAMIGPVAMSVLLRGVPYDIRYTSAGFPFYCGLVAIGVTLISPRALRAAAVVVMLAVGLASLSTNYFKPYKEDWRGAFGWVAAAVRPDDVTLFPGLKQAPITWDVYHPHRPPLPHASLEEVLEGRRPAARVWLFVYSRTVIAERAGRATAAALERQGYARVERREYHWVDTSVWERRTN